MRVAAAIVLCLAAAGAAAAEYFPVGHVLRPLLADPVEPRSFVGLLSADAADTDAPSDDLINSDFVIGGRLVAGMDVKGFEETDWDAGVSGKLGLQFGAPHPARRGLSLFLVVYDGFAPFGQFPSTEVRYYGASLQFDF